MSPLLCAPSWPPTMMMRSDSESYSII
jgi:hypothetical protein